MSLSRKKSLFFAPRRSRKPPSGAKARKKRVQENPTFAVVQIGRVIYIFTNWPCYVLLYKARFAPNNLVGSWFEASPRAF